MGINNAYNKIIIIVYCVVIFTYIIEVNFTYIPESSFTRISGSSFFPISGHELSSCWGRFPRYILYVPCLVIENTNKWVNNMLIIRL